MSTAPTNSAFTAIKRQSLEDQRQSLLEEYQAANAQLARTLSDVDRVRLERQLRDLEQRIDKTEADLVADQRQSPEKRLADLGEEYSAIEQQYRSTQDDQVRVKLRRQREIVDRGMEELHHQLKARSDNRWQREMAWKDRLPYIDFQEAHEIFLEVDQRLHQGGGGAALLLLQGYSSMGGRLFVTRMREMLRQQFVGFRSYEIELAAGASSSVLDVLNKLSQQLGCNPCRTPATRQDIHEHAKTLIKQLCGSLRSGYRVLLEVRVWDTTNLHHQFLPWLLQDLFLPLVDSINERVREQPLIKLYVVIAVIPSLQIDGEESAWYCTRHNFDSRKILELPLTLWQRTDIEEWLFQYSGLTSPPIDLPRDEIAEIAHRVHSNNSNGQPKGIESDLIGILLRYYEAADRSV